MILLYASDVSPLKDSELYGAAYAAAGEERRKKADRCRLTADKKRSLGAGLVLNKALRDYGIDNSVSGFITGEYGKLYLTGVNSPYFSLSHSGNWVLCAVSPFECGCDIEKINKIDINIAKRFFCPDEYRAIEEIPDDSGKAEMFFRFWTLKESYIKATGLGMSQSLCEFNIILTGDKPVLQSENQSAYSFAEFDGINGYKVALCTLGDISGAELKTIKITDCL